MPSHAGAAQRKALHKAGSREIGGMLFAEQWSSVCAPYMGSRSNAS